MAVAIDALAVALHVELLQVGRQAVQILVVRQHRVRLGAEEVRVPDAEQAERDRQVLFDRRGAEVLVHLVRAVEESARSARSRWRARSAGRSTTTANSGRRPSPRTRTCSPARCRTPLTSFSLVETATKCFATCASSLARARNHARADRALVIVSCGRERLRRDDEQRRLGIQPAQRLGQVRPSTFDTKCRRGPSRAYGVSAAVAIAGPRSDPPMPMLTTSVMRRPV